MLWKTAQTGSLPASADIISLTKDHSQGCDKQSRCSFTTRIVDTSTQLKAADLDDHISTFYDTMQFAVAQVQFLRWWDRLQCRERELNSWQGLEWRAVNLSIPCGKKGGNWEEVLPKDNHWLVPKDSNWLVPKGSEGVDTWWHHQSIINRLQELDGDSPLESHCGGSMSASSSFFLKGLIGMRKTLTWRWNNNIQSSCMDISYRLRSKLWKNHMVINGPHNRRLYKLQTISYSKTS